MASESKRDDHHPEAEDRRDLVAMRAQYRGPLPPPEMLERYNQVLPGTAERIVHRFEKEAEHRQALERQIVAAQIKRDDAEVTEIRRGQWFGFLIGALGLLTGGAVAILSRSDAGAYAGAAIGGATLVGLVTAFVVGRRARPPATDDERNEKRTSPDLVARHGRENRDSPA